MLRVRSETAGKEPRLIRLQKSYVGRFFNRLEKYDYANPLEVAAAGTHTVTQFFGGDPALRDVSRWIDSDNSPIPELRGHFARTREDVFDGINDLFHPRPFSAATKALNIIGDVTADAADDLAGIPQREATRAKMFRFLHRPTKN